jgi:hypothetical protein
MRLLDLEPQFLKIVDATHYQDVDTLQESDGIIFICPQCVVNKGGLVGSHSIICWRPQVSQEHTPIPGRWEFHGTSYHDLTLVAGSSSVLLNGPGCGAHFFVRSGLIELLKPEVQQ